MSGGKRQTWRPLKPAEVVHETTNAFGMAMCGATEREGARFSGMFKQTTCPKCRERVLGLRAEAKARMVRELAT